MSDKTTEPEMTEDERIDAAALDDLKARAKAAGLAFHPSIGAERLSEKLEEHRKEVAAREAEKTQGPEGVGTEPAPTPDVLIRKGQKYHPAKALVRVRVSSMDPLKKEYDGEIISASNGVIGTVKRHIPFGVPWHIEQILLNTLRDKKFQAFRVVKERDGTEVKRGKQMPAYAIEIMDPLTAQEMDELRQRQLAQRSTADE